MENDTSPSEVEITKPEMPKPNNSFPIVGLGASAGGLKALQEFFAHMPADNGMAFVVIMHLSPQHESHAAEILQNSTVMPVMQVNERVKVEPNHVYVIPPIKHLSLSDEYISLIEPDQGLGRHVAIDLFFRTLAATHGTRTACIILSGTGSDGSIGLRRVKEEGGIAFAQDPAEAEYDAMPRNAINTGAVDFVLPVAEIPYKLIEIWRNSQQIKLPQEEPLPEVDQKERSEQALRDILTLVRTRTGHDFTHYKRATILRRIERRLQVTTMPDLPAYQSYLRQNPPEAKLLLKDLLIGVTSFFRDPAAWEALEREVIPQLFQNKEIGDTIRVWVAGCASGEEAYSVAVLLHEFAATMAQPPDIQIFATDIDEDAIAVAREGQYPASIEADVSPERLRHFFVKDMGGGYRINKEVRESVLFAVHNLIKDPPFSRLDLITCRNLLIYLTRNVQGQVFELFRFALRTSGYLFLGGSESVEGAADLFSTVEKKQHIFRVNTVRPATRHFPALPLEPPLTDKFRNQTAEATERKQIAYGELHQRLVERYAPPSVIVNADYDIVHLSENAGRFLRLTGGEATLNLLKVVLPELRLGLRTALFQAEQTNRSTEAPHVQLNQSGRTTYVNLVVRPTADAAIGTQFFLVLFDEVEETLGTEGREQIVSEAVPLVEQLEAESLRLREQLQATVEQYETTVEELKASNEELQAINEELRSTTEELETSKEEMQSVNEELRTVNQELKNKVDEVSSTNDDLQNLMASTDIATIFLDRNFCIKRFTPAALKIFNLIPADEGRRLTDITHKLAYDNLLADTESVLETLHKVEKEIASHSGRVYLVRLLPYRTASDRIAGVVITFVDITERKRTETNLAFLAEVSQELAHLTSIDETMKALNAKIGRFFGVKQCMFAEHADGFTTSVVAYGWHAKAARDLKGTYRMRDFLTDTVMAELLTGEPLIVSETQTDARVSAESYGALGIRSFIIVPLVREREWRFQISIIDDQPRAWAEWEVSLMREITHRIWSRLERARAEEALANSEEKFRTLFESIDEGFCIIEMLFDEHEHPIDYRYLDVSPAFEKQTGIKNAVGRRMREIEPRHEEHWFETFGRIALTGKPMRFERYAQFLEDRWYDVYAFRVGQPQEHRVGILFKDITTRKQADDTLRQTQADLQARVEERTRELTETNRNLQTESAQRLAVEAERQRLLRHIVRSQEEERRRISRELHDSFGQKLTALRLKLEVLKEQIHGSPNLQAPVEQLGQLAEQLDAEADLLVWQLHPAALDYLGLVEALENYLKEWSEHFNIAAEFQSSGLQANLLTQELETNLYRIAQEALNNISRHADATRVEVLLERRQDHLTLTVEDNGKGFEVNAEEDSDKRGLGLINMRERAELFGGTVEIESLPQNGTSVYVRIPLVKSGESK